MAIIMIYMIWTVWILWYDMVWTSARTFDPRKVDSGTQVSQWFAMAQRGYPSSHDGSCGSSTGGCQAAVPHTEDASNDKNAIVLLVFLHLHDCSFFLPFWANVPFWVNRRLYHRFFLCYCYLLSKPPPKKEFGTGDFTRPRGDFTRPKCDFTRPLFHGSLAPGIFVAQQAIFFEKGKFLSNRQKSAPFRSF